MAASYRFQANAIAALQEALEGHLVRMFECKLIQSSLYFQDICTD